MEPSEYSSASTSQVRQSWTSGPASSDLLCQARVPERIPPTPPILYRTFKEWRDRIFRSRCFREGENDGLNAIGPTAEAIAHTLLDILEFHWASINNPTYRGVFEPRVGVTCDLQPLHAFISDFHQFEM
jgi:hypothetical protein